MIGLRKQSALIRKYTEARTGLMEKKALNENIQQDLGLSHGEGKMLNAGLIFVDIAGFSGKVSALSPDKVCEYLEYYYSVALPIIDRNFGCIDRIAGDGILAVYLKELTNFSSQETRQCLFDSAFELVESFMGTDMECKVSIAAGQLLFCRTGLEGIYEEFTVIGSPITIAYRLDSHALANEVIVEPRHLLELSLLSRLGADGIIEGFELSWSYGRRLTTLRGVGVRRPVVLTPC